MDPIIKWLQRFFDTSDLWQSELSERWRPHANRRTVVIAVIVGAVEIFSYIALIQPPRDFPVNELVSVTEGASLDSIARQLQKDGVVRSALAFRLIVTA